MTIAFGFALSLVATSGMAMSLAAAPATVQLKQDAKLGNILADGNNMTLYIFKKDTAGVSNCNDACAQAWPPLTLDQGTPVAGDGVTGTLSLITRPDGSHQVALNGMPLYRYAKDEDAGDAYGQGVGGNWFVVMATDLAAPAASAPAAAPTTAAPAAQAVPAGLPNTGDAPSIAPLAGALAVVGVVTLGLGAALRRRRAR
jgi:LPXTG-motif cell wall-anchored protein